MLLSAIINTMVSYFSLSKVACKESGCDGIRDISKEGIVEQCSQCGAYAKYLK